MQHPLRGQSQKVGIFLGVGRVRGNMFCAGRHPASDWLRAAHQITVLGVWRGATSDRTYYVRSELVESFYLFLCILLKDYII